jgi:hypothetical protein
VKEGLRIFARVRKRYARQHADDIDVIDLAGDDFDVRLARRA